MSWVFCGVTNTWVFIINASFSTWWTFFTTPVICTSAAIQKGNQSPDKCWCCQVRIPDCQIKKENWATLPFLFICHSHKKHFMVFLFFVHYLNSHRILFSWTHPLEVFRQNMRTSVDYIQSYNKKTLCGCLTFARRDSYFKTHFYWQFLTSNLAIAKCVFQQFLKL